MNPNTLQGRPPEKEMPPSATTAHEAAFGTVAYSHPTQEIHSDGLWVLVHGTRAQPRKAMRQLKAGARRGDPAAIDLLAEVRRAGR